MAWFERLTSLDVLFIDLESRTAHMHVGAVAVFDGPPPTYRDLLRLIEARLAYVPRYRQRLMTVPFNQGRPVWIDDAQFDIEYHVRHTALPPPGGHDELLRLAGRLMSQQLDRDKPLWELWFVEGLGDGRFAVVSKTHHCMIDGVSGVDLATVLMDVEQRSEPPAAPPAWEARPAPTRRELLVSSLREQVANPVQLVRDAVERSRDARTVLRELAANVGPLLGVMRLGQAPPSSLNRPIGPHRRIETVRLALDEVKRVRAGLARGGGERSTVNDVILAVVAGALRRVLLARGDHLGEDLRVLVPVSVRSADARGTFGNQVTAMFCPLPVGEADPVERLHRVSAAMRGLKESGQAVGARTLSRLAEFAPPTLLSQAARLQARTRFFNLVVTNVPGPQLPLYLLGHRMRGCYPVVPLTETTSIGVALLSYDGAIGVGLVGDADAARDLRHLATAMREALDELRARAERPTTAAPVAGDAAGAG